MAATTHFGILKHLYIELPVIRRCPEREKRHSICRDRWIDMLRIDQGLDALGRFRECNARKLRREKYGGAKQVNHY
jgi:hypothetical protein